MKLSQIPALSKNMNWYFINGLLNHNEVVVLIHFELKNEQASEINKKWDKIKNGRWLQINQLSPSSKSIGFVSKGNLIALFNLTFHNTFDRACVNG